SRTGLRKIIIGVLRLSSVAACTWTGMGTDGVVAKRVYIVGTLQYASADRIAQTVAPYLGVPFFDVEIDAIARRLNALPWLANVSVDRHWPDGVVVHVNDHRPIALWGEGQVLTADFAVVTPETVAPLLGLPR